MAKRKIRYRQCRLESSTPTGRVETVSYLPTKFAKVGQFVGLKGDDFTRTWKVTSAGQITDNPPDWRADIRGHRKMTGDSNPKRTEVGV